MERWCGRVALVTGASAGIGYATAVKLVKNGMKVVGCARRLDKLQALAQELSNEKGTFYPVQCDLSKESDILSMFKQIKEKHSGADVIINNGGLGFDAPLLSGKTEDWKQMLDVNVLGLCICSREGVKSMLERKVDDGHLIHVSSMSGHRVIPHKETHFYAASKFAVRAILEGHRNELREMKSHIRVSEISPGLVSTEFAYNLGTEENAKKLYASIECLQADDMADAILYALSAPPHVQVHDILIRPTEQVS